MNGDESRAIPEYQFIELLNQVLNVLLQVDTVISEPLLAGRFRPDFMARLVTGHDAIVEARSVTPNTQRRLEGVVEQLAEYAKAYVETYPDARSPELILAVPGVLSDEHKTFLIERGLNRIIDGPAIRAAAVGQPYLPSWLAEPEESQPPSTRTTARNLLDRLGTVKAGRNDWSRYQTLCGDILAFLLCPPLEQPIRESASRSGVNRRDYVFPNYASQDFWSYMQGLYQAHYVVVDAKNYVGNVKKQEILQLANYLSPHGAGLFGMIVSRGGGDRSAEITRREQWALNHKLIIVLNDNDLRQMLRLRISDSDPAEVVRQKIEDFRLGF